MTKPSRAFRASPPNASLPSLITRLPTRQRSSSSMLWNHHHHHQGKGTNEEGEVALSSSLPSVLPLPPALQHTNGSSSSMRQKLLPPLGESHNAPKATTHSSCFIHMGKENCFSGCNPMALLKRSFSTPLDSGTYIYVHTYSLSPSIYMCLFMHRHESIHTRYERRMCAYVCMCV